MTAFIGTPPKSQKLVIPYKKSQFYCDSCGKVVIGEGFLIPALNKAFCEEHYKQEFKKYWEDNK